MNSLFSPKKLKKCASKYDKMTTQMFKISQQAQITMEHALHLAIFISMLEDWLNDIPILCTVFNGQCIIDATLRSTQYRLTYNPAFPPRAAASYVIFNVSHILMPRTHETTYAFTANAHTRAYAIFRDLMLWRHIPDN